MLKTNSIKQSNWVRILIASGSLLMTSCAFSTWRLQIFSPNSQANQSAERIWYSEVHGGAAKTGPNDMLVLRLKGSKDVNVLLMAKPTLYQRSTEGFLFIPLVPGNSFSPTKLYTPEDPDLLVGLAYDDLSLRLGDDCFRVNYGGKVIRGDVKHSSTNAKSPVNPGIFPGKKEDKEQIYGLLELRFPIDPYPVENFRLLACTVFLENEPFNFPEIDFTKVWQDRSWSGP